MEASLSERANAEADEVEAAEANEPDPEDDESKPTEQEEPDPAAVVDEAAIRKAERAISDQKARLEKILGKTAVAHDCPICEGLGYLAQAPPIGAALVFVETDDGIGYEITAPGVPPELLDARDKVACDWCKGFGQVRSGSKNPNAAIVGCTKCAGNGWVTVAADVQQNHYVPPPAGQAANGSQGQSMEVPDDAWARPYGHPHYGMPPSMVGVDVP